MRPSPGLTLLLLVLLAVACGPPGPNLATTRTGQRGLFRATFVSETEPPPVHLIHRWRLHLETLDGRPVEGARIEVGGGMPEHQHGLPTKPQVTADLGQGDYLVEGMKFSMPGYWVLDLEVSAGAESDRLLFERMLSE